MNNNNYNPVIWIKLINAITKLVIRDQIVRNVLSLVKVGASTGMCAVLRTHTKMVNVETAVAADVQKIKIKTNNRIL